MRRGKSVTYVLGTLGAISNNVLHVCDAAPRPKGPKGPCGGAARRSAAEPEAPMYIRADICSCAKGIKTICYFDSVDTLKLTCARALDGEGTDSGRPAIFSPPARILSCFFFSKMYLRYCPQGSR